MTDFPEALAVHLRGEVTTVCHCWLLSRRDGWRSGYTDHDRPLTVGSQQYAPHSGLSASEARETLGLAVDTVDVEGALSSDDISEDDIAAGLFDGATVETFLVNWRAPTDFVRLRRATIGRITCSDGRFVAEFESLVHTLDRPDGRYVSRSCDAELGDARCGVVLEGPAHAAGGTVVDVQAAALLVVEGLEGFTPGWFAHGVLTWVTGARAGLTERIEDHRTDLAGTLLVLRQGNGTVASGDVFTIIAGCDKTFATCKAKFANPLNFRGFPHLPGNDKAYGYVVDGDRFDAGPIVP